MDSKEEEQKEKENAVISSRLRRQAKRGISLRLPLRRRYSTFQKSIPAACSGTSTVATVLRAGKSMISTVPGSDPIPSTVTKATRESGATTTPCTTFRLVFNRASSKPLAASKIEAEGSRLLVAIRYLPSGETPRL